MNGAISTCGPFPTPIASNHLTSAFNHAPPGARVLCTLERSVNLGSIDIFSWPTRTGAAIIKKHNIIDPSTVRHIDLDLLVSSPALVLIRLVLIFVFRVGNSKIDDYAQDNAHTHDENHSEIE